MRLLALVAVVAAVAVVPAALGADGNVVAQGLSFTPAEIAVKPGEKVTWTNPSAGTHNVHFEDGQHDVPTDPSPSWQPANERTFTAEGVYPYYCELHGGPGGSGMSGTVYVNTAGELPTATPSPSMTATPGSTPTPSPTTTPRPGETPVAGVTPTATPAATVVSRTFSITSAKRFCLRRRARCRRPGITLKLTANARFRLTGRLFRGARRFGVLRLGARPGTRTIRFERRTSDGRRLVAGRYRLVIAGAGPARTLRFTLR